MFLWLKKWVWFIKFVIDKPSQFSVILNRRKCFRLLAIYDISGVIVIYFFSSWKTTFILIMTLHFLSSLFVIFVIFFIFLPSSALSVDNFSFNKLFPCIQNDVAGLGHARRFSIARGWWSWVDNTITCLYINHIL